ncbi:FkbM family methyltransferase [Candidatus Thiodictyon syntrophicum]|jgi:FkbM family methyltransferase|nr:FkbM family methyltransferase [Candidatus Thiodictyon syntrophicum]
MNTPPATLRRPAVGVIPLWRTLAFLASHPLNRGHIVRAFSRYLRWQLAIRLLPGAAVVPFVGSSKLLVRRGMTGATGNIYAGLHEPQDMAFAALCLRPGDVFVDVGANVGAYTVLVTTFARAVAIAIEPNPQAMATLKMNLCLNRIVDQVECHTCAVGAGEEIARMTTDLDTMNHLVTNDTHGNEHLAQIPLRSLDQILGNRSATLIKLDVEGYELPALEGATRTLGAAPLLAVVLELNGSGARYRRTDQEVHELMCARGFRPFAFGLFDRRLSPLQDWRHDVGNTLYVRDPAAVLERLASAPPLPVLHHWL